MEIFAFFAIYFCSSFSPVCWVTLSACTRLSPGRVTLRPWSPQPASCTEKAEDPNTGSLGLRLTSARVTEAGAQTGASEAEAGIGAARRDRHRTRIRSPRERTRVEGVERLWPIEVDDAHARQTGDHELVSRTHRADGAPLQRPSLQRRSPVRQRRPHPRRRLGDGVRRAASRLRNLAKHYQ